MKQLKQFKQLTCLVLALLMICTSFAWNGLKVKAEDSTATTMDELALYYNTVEQKLVGGGTIGSVSFNSSSSYNQASLSSNSFITLDLEETWQKVTIKTYYIASHNTTHTPLAENIVSLGGKESTDYVWCAKESSNSWKDLIVVLTKNKDGSWSAQYSADKGATYTTVEGTFDKGDEKIYIGKVNAGGMFSFRTLVITATKLPDAKVDGKEIASLKDALTAAKTATDKTVTLLNDVRLTNDELLVSGVTLDLAGHVLDLGDTSYLSAFTGANVIDSVGDGLLKVADDKLMLPENNTYMPVYDSTSTGYRLATVTITDKDVTNPTGAPIEFKTRPDFGADSVHALVAGGSDASKVNVGIRLEWEGTDGTPYVQDCYLTDTFLNTMYGDATNPYGATFTLTSTDNFKNIMATPFVTSLLGVEKLGTAHVPATE